MIVRSADGGVICRAIVIAAMLVRMFAFPCICVVAYRHQPNISLIRNSNAPPPPFRAHSWITDHRPFGSCFDV